MRQDRLAGEASTLPAASFARTWNVCWPFLRFLYVFGERQALHAPRSSLHWNVELVSVAVKRNVATRERVRAAGPPRSLVFGAVMSGAASSLAIVTSVRPSATCAAGEASSRSEKVSFGSKAVSPATSTVTVLLVSPGAKVSDPAAGV